MGSLRPARPHHRGTGRRRDHLGHRQPAARNPMTTAARPTPSRAGSRQHRWGSDRGSASIGFAITAAAVIAIMFTAIQAATWFWARSIALAAAQEAANAQRAYNAAPGAGQARANAFIASTGDGLTATTITVTSDGQQVQATVAG